MSRRIRPFILSTVLTLSGVILAQSGVSFADTVQSQQRPAQNQIQNPPQGQPQAQPQGQPQPQIQQRPVQQTYRRAGVTPPPIAAMTLPSIGPSNYTVAHSERIYWGTADRNPPPQLLPRLPGMGQSPQTPPPVNTASVYRYLPPSAMRETSAAVGLSAPTSYQNAMQGAQTQASSPFGPPLPPVNLQP